MFLLFTVRLVITTAVLALLCAAEYNVGAATLTHQGINGPPQCQSTYDCASNEACERVCFWEHASNAYIGCKVICVERPPPLHPQYFTNAFEQIHRPAPAAYTPTTPPQLNYNALGSHANAPVAPAPPLQVPDTNCTSDYQCAPYKYCALQRCICKHGYISDPYDPLLCTPAHLNEYPVDKAFPCHGRHDCGQFAYCAYGECKCQNGFVRSTTYPYECQDYEPYNKIGRLKTCYADHECPYGEQCCRWAEASRYGYHETTSRCMSYCT